MSYKPLPSDAELDILLSKRLDELLSNIRQVSSMYVEPGDLIIVRVDDEADDKTLSLIRKVLSNLFKENPGLFMTNDIDVQVLRRSEEFKEELNNREQTKNAILALEKRVSELETLVLKNKE